MENDIVFNLKKIARRLPRGRRVANDRSPDIEEIKKILGYPDRRMKPAALIMISSGCRIGAFDYLNWGDIEPIYKSGQKGPIVAARIKIYAGTNDEYASFVTPEAYKAVSEYVNFRTEQGERISKSSPVIRDLFHPDRLGRG